MEQQVNKEHYDFGKYVTMNRWASYFTQLKETIALKPTSVLEVGVGDGIFGLCLKSQTDIAYQSLDIAPDLKPDIVGKINSIPLPDNSVDCVVAFEVLEHIPFEEVPKAIVEMMRVTRKNVIVSMPHFGPPIKFVLKLPFLREIRLSFKIPYHPKHVWNGEHYWEIGKKDTPPHLVKKVLSTHGKLLKDFLLFDNQYHHFYILEKK